MRSEKSRQENLESDRRNIDYREGGERGMQDNYDQNRRRQDNIERGRQNTSSRGKDDNMERVQQFNPTFNGPEDVPSCSSKLDEVSDGSIWGNICTITHM